MTSPAPEGLELLEDTYLDPINCKWVIEDDLNESVVDGVNILGRVVGEMFIVEGSSLNKRYYKRELWEKAINESLDSMTSGSMVGTISHQQPLDDLAFLEGKVSHRVTKLWIDESGKGMGELLILNSTAGRTLNAYLRGGVNLPVSSRAFGKYSGKMGESAIVDPKTFKLEGFDFVRTPGVPSAVPKLVENLNTNQPNEVRSMDLEKAFEDLKKERDDLALQVKSTNEEMSKLRENHGILDFKFNDLDTKFTEARAELARLKAYESLGSVDDINKKLKVLKTYEELGTRNELVTVMSKAETLVEELQAAKAEVEEVKKSVATVEESAPGLEKLKAYEALGTVDEVEKLCQYFENHLDNVEATTTVTESLSAYAALGTVEQISKVMDFAEAYVDLGTPDEVAKVYDVTESYLQLGTPLEIEESLEIAEGLITLRQNQVNEDRAKSIATHYNVDTTVVAEMLESMSEEAVSSTLSKLTSKKNMDRFVVQENVAKDKDESLDESLPATSTLVTGSRASRMFESFNR